MQKHAIIFTSKYNFKLIDYFSILKKKIIEVVLCQSLAAKLEVKLEQSEKITA